MAAAKQGRLSRWQRKVAGHRARAIRARRSPYDSCEAIPGPSFMMPKIPIIGDKMSERQMKMSPFSRPRTRLAIPCFVLAAVLPAYSAEPAKEESRTEFTRLTKTEDGAPLALEASIVRFAPMDCGKDGPTVDLVSAVHVAEASYFEQLNRRFEQYDAVLYELVAPEGTTIPKGGGEGGGSAVSMLQTTMKDVLKLEFQLNGIDYTAANFVHADMTPQQFSESMRERGETVFKIFLRMLGHAMSQQERPGPGTDLRLLFALFDKNRALALKRVLAEEFQDMEGSLSAINGPDGSTLITERNKVALEVLRKQVAAGHKKLAIFYGAGHMSDFEQRLRDDFALAPLETTWLTAWDLKGDAKSAASPSKPDDAGKVSPDQKTSSRAGKSR
ncbi:MAG: hypothetical protein ACYC6Y_06950 [Thermoguttaceae bacterium]